MRGSIETRRSKVTGRVSYRPRVYVGRRDAGRYGLSPGWHYGGTFGRLRKKDGCESAEQALEDLTSRLLGASQPVACSETLRVLAERWLRDVVRPAGRQNTTRAHERALADHILEVVVRADSQPVRLGDLAAREVGPADIAEWQGAQLTGGRLDGRPGGCAVKSVRNYRGTLHLLFEWLAAAHPGDFAANPVTAVKAPRFRRQAPTPPTLEVAQRYIEALRRAGTEVRVSPGGHRYGVRYRSSRFWPALVIGGFSGMRRGEVLALRWSDASWRVESGDEGEPHLVGGVRIDPRRGNLTGRTKASLRFGPPKTDKGARYVPLPEPALAALAELKAERMRQLLPGEFWDESALICCGGSGQPIVPDDLTHKLPGVLRRRGLPPLNFHALRHMVATEMRRAGVDRDVLAEHLGHADQATTAIYDHVSEADQASAAEAFERRCREAERARRAQIAPNDGVVVPLRRGSEAG